MATLTVVFRLRRHGSALPTVPSAVVRAAVYSVVSAVLAVVAHHVAFNTAPSWAARVVAMAALFAVRLRGASRPVSLHRQLAGAFGAQAALCWWFGQPGGDGLVALFRAGWPVVVTYAVVTLVMGCLLHGVDDSWSRLWRTLGAALWRILFPVRGHAPYEVSGLLAAVPGVPEAARAAPHGARLAYAVVRRGPPHVLLLAV
jgi:hypothetical protein